MPIATVCREDYQSHTAKGAGAAMSHSAWPLWFLLHAEHLEPRVRRRRVAFLRLCVAPAFEPWRSWTVVFDPEFTDVVVRQCVWPQHTDQDWEGERVIEGYVFGDDGKATRIRKAVHGDGKARIHVSDVTLNPGEARELIASAARLAVPALDLSVLNRVVVDGVLFWFIADYGHDPHIYLRWHNGSDDPTESAGAALTFRQWFAHTCDDLARRFTSP